MTDGHDFDWVRARAKCSPIQMFKEIEVGVRDDVDAINSQRHPEDRFKFTVIRNSSGNYFTVIREMDNGSQQVAFELTPQGIKITKETGAEILARTTLNAGGQCRLKVDGRELQQWQLRQLALEDLFFFKEA